jgi:hypothetical protein
MQYLEKLESPERGGVSFGMDAFAAPDPLSAADRIATRILTP